MVCALSAMQENDKRNTSNNFMGYIYFLSSGLSAQQGPSCTAEIHSANSSALTTGFVATIVHQSQTSLLAKKPAPSHLGQRYPQVLIYFELNLPQYKLNY
jgi:hypothetical protein